LGGACAASFFYLIFYVMSKFTLFKGTNGSYYFNLKAGNGEKVLSSEAYTYKSSCETGIASVRANAPLDIRYEKRRSVNAQYYFVLKGSNGEIIGTSEMYYSETSRDHGIGVVKKEAPGASVEDLTSKIGA
jgi:uncharacterized protein